MTPTKTAKLYKGEIIIDFYEQHGRYKHVYINRNTEEWPVSVTGATGIVNKPALIFWAVKLARTYLIEKLENGEVVNVDDVIEACKQHQIRKEKGADKGTQVHDWAEKYINFKLGKLKEKPEQPKDEQVLNGVLAFLKWEKEHNVKFLASEQLIYSKKFDYVGILDCKAKVDGKVRVVDFKTSSGIYNEMIYQVSAYQMADAEETGKKYDACPIIARFDKDTAEFEIKELPEYQKDFKAFLGALAIKKREKELSKK